MGELFEGPLPKHLPEGDRLATAAVKRQIDSEHLHRYFLARHFCRDHDVLELYSAEGYGSAILAQVARSVIGVDIDPQVVAQARAAYIMGGLRYVVGDARTVPLPDNSVDRVVAFNAFPDFGPNDRSSQNDSSLWDVRCLQDVQRVLQEAQRVLRPDGIFICRLPSRCGDLDAGAGTDTFQRREPAGPAVEAVLSKTFPHVRVMSQRPIAGSVILPVGANLDMDIVTYDRRGANSYEASDDLPGARCWVTLASNQPLPRPVQSYYSDVTTLDEPPERLAVKSEAECVERHDDGLERSLAKVQALFANHYKQHESELAESAERLREARFHLDRLNSYGWTRLGFAIDRLLALPLRLLHPRRGNAGENIIPAAPVPSSIHFKPAIGTPDVSMVVLSYAQCDYTLRCLASIAALDCRCSIEVMLSDDCSNAPDLAAIAKIPNLRVLAPPRNLGFLRHANWAVAQSKGKYVLLLNNDTELQSGAVDALHDIAAANDDVGLVGSKLVYPDGRLQEAGGIVWEDGSAWNFGHSEDPLRPEFNYVRESDYISGASILVPRIVWDRLGGFDERYAPAYCEDSDFAFRVREHGLRVLYAPKSVVVHHEGISHGTDLNAGLKAYQVRNSKLLKDRWQATLAEKHFPAGTHIMRARDRARDRRIILVIDHYVPEPDRDAGSRTLIEMIKSLQMIGSLVKFWPDNRSPTTPYTENLQEMGVEVFYEPYHNSFQKWFAAHFHELDLVIVNRPSIAPQYIEDIKSIAAHLPLVYYGHDLHAQRLRAQAQIDGDPRLMDEAVDMEAIERRIWRAVDVVTYPSASEIETVKSTEPSAVGRVILPYCFDTFPPVRSPVANLNILFVGGFGHAPNIDAACWFTSEIFPLVIAKVPAAKLCIAGSNPTPSVIELRRDNIDVTGTLSTAALATCYRQARVAVVPLRYGAGVKLKVVEALHAALPLVTTSTGAQGIPDLGRVAIVKDVATDIADAVVDLLTNDAAWLDQSERQHAFARSHFSREASIRSLSEVIQAATRRRRVDRTR